MGAKSMFRRKKDQASVERLDQIGRNIVRAATSNEAEAEAAASSPFLYTRVRARILAEQERREAGERWFAMLSVVRRAVPAMGLTAILAFGAFWFTVLHTSSPMNFGAEALFGPDDTEFERIAFADRGTLTNDEVLSAVIEDDEQEAVR